MCVLVIVLKVRAWSGVFGAGPPPRDVDMITGKPRPNSAVDRLKLSESGRTFREIHELCHTAREYADGTRRSRPATAREPPRPKVPELQYNEKSAFVNAIPGYQGFRPRVRKPYPKNPNGVNMATVNSRAYVAPAKMPAFKRHAPPAWELTEYRKVCYINIGKGSPYVKDLALAGNPLEKTIKTNCRPGEYFVEMHPTVPPNRNLTRGAQNSNF